ncbi:hypothetical protein GCM10009814_06280 [Lapillicoccus jejuensis]
MPERVTNEVTVVTDPATVGAATTVALAEGAPTPVVRVVEESGRPGTVVPAGAAAGVTDA